MDLTVFASYSPQWLDLNYTPIMVSKTASSLYGLGIAWTVLTAVFLVIRFWSRALTQERFGADDWVALSAWPFVAALCLLSSAWTKYGFGNHIWEVPMGNIVKGLQILYAGEIVYNAGICLIRISATLFYCRLFAGGHQYYRWILRSNLILNVLWLTIFIPLAIAPCRPVNAFWDKSIKTAVCYDLLKLQIGAGIASVFLDVFTLVLPLPTLWRLQMNTSKKLFLVGIFAVGYGVVVITIGRVASITAAGDSINKDLTHAFVTPLYWFVCEIGVASVGIELPSIFQFAKRAHDHGFGSLFTTRQFAASTLARAEAPPRHAQLNKRNHMGLDHPDLELNYHQKGTATAVGSEGASIASDLESSEIRRTTTVTVEVSKRGCRTSQQ